MSSPSIQSMLQQMHSLSAEASGQQLKGQSVSTSVGQGGFADELNSSLQRINEMQQAAASKRTDFLSGNSNVALNDVMVDMQKASVAFDMGVQVRNRLVTAYKDVMNMQV
ncbi:flagellar hook-basal body complex protein FliE [Onishia niordana]|uniref:flagellar hook-basal body complex protein FliE n=1 Tax=Onishia niordana TaxID=2508711 RepID=UPI0010A067FF|nr:flagellar hook-basal body complex protein FliE [Halomonas niordiana]